MRSVAQPGFSISIAKEPQIYPVPITKKGPIPIDLIPAEEDPVVSYETQESYGYEEYIELFLGSLAGYALQGKKEVMRKFIEHLNQIAKGLGNEIWEKFLSLRKQLLDHFNDSNGPIVWCSEISFTPNRSQVEFISAALKSPIIRAIAAENDYQDVESFVRDLLFNSTNPQPNMSVTIDGQVITLKQLLSETSTRPRSMRQILEQLTQENLAKNQKIDLFSRFLKSIVSYYYFNFTGVVKPEDMPLPNERIIAAASARVDLLGFKVSNPDDQEAKDLLKEIQSKRILNHLLLDFNTWLTPESEELIRKLLEMINQKRIVIIFAEIKSYFNPNLIAKNNPNSSKDGEFLDQFANHPIATQHTTYPENLEPRTTTLQTLIAQLRNKGIKIGFYPRLTDQNSAKAEGDTLSSAQTNDQQYSKPRKKYQVYPMQKFRISAIPY